MLVQRQVGYQRLYLAVLFPQLAQFAQLAYPDARVPLLPRVEGLLRDPHIPADVGYLFAALHLA